MNRPALALLTVLALAANAAAQEQDMNAATLAHALDRLASSARVLYVAAHPDDENTRLLAYLANGRHVTAGYLSMTRGGGGQNLIGREQDELLDAIRTQELLAARRLDGATQRFTTMRDFGFSKSADETLAIWGREQALADVVWVIRTFQPDVIIARFNELPPNHGHHTASAILAREAFTAAADPTRFPEQIALGVEPWQAKRLLLNVPTWTNEPPPAGALSLDVGTYDPRLGLSYGELAARSRSQHKSQGFGVPGERGQILENFVVVAGDKPQRDILDGVDLGWDRYGDAGRDFSEAIGDARARLERDQPEKALSALLAAQKALAKLPDQPRTRAARIALDQIIAGAAGVFVRAAAAQPSAVPGSSVKVDVEIVQRRPAPMTVKRVQFPGGLDVEERANLGLNQKVVVTRDVAIPSDASISSPYWLAQPSLPSRQVVSDPKLVGLPEGPPPLSVGVDLTLEGEIVRLDVPVVYAWNDRVHGERLRTFLIVPPATVTPSRHAVMFANGRSAVVSLRVRAGADALRGDVDLGLPAGWSAKPGRIPVELAHAGDETTVQFTVTPPKGSTTVEVHPSVASGGRSWSYREDVIDYPHIPMQIVLQQSSLKLVPLELKLPKVRIGYIPGSGDTVAEDLAHVGMNVEQIDDETLRSGDLSRYGAIIVGIRAYNTKEVLRAAHTRLMDYVFKGGTVVVQYNTTSPREPLDTPIGPFPLTIGRGRVTDEDATMEIVNPEATVLHAPNEIGAADFEGWVQERGLYYGETWDDRYQPIFRAADKGEAPLAGGLLVADYGKGRYLYTGLGFFRQLPAGTPGAYRLFVNLLERR